MNCVSLEYHNTMAFCQIRGGNNITRYEAINNTRGHLTVNSQSTQSQSLSNRERLLGIGWVAGRWECDVPLFPLGIFVCEGGGLDSRKSMSFLVNGWVGMTHTHMHTQDTRPVRFCHQHHQGPTILMQQCKKSSLPSSKYAWIKAWITMASCHLKTGLLLSNKQTYPSQGLIGLIKEVLSPLFPGAPQRKGNFEMLSKEVREGGSGGSNQSCWVTFLKSAHLIQGEIFLSDCHRMWHDKPTVCEWESDCTALNRQRTPRLLPRLMPTVKREKEAAWSHKQSKYGPLLALARRRTAALF